MFAHAIARINPDHDEQHVERLRVLPAQGVQSSGAILEAQHRKVRALTRIGRRRRHPLIEGSGQRRLGLREPDAGTQTSHHLEPVIVLIEELPLARPVEQETGAERQIEARDRTRIDAEELRRSDADHGEGDVVDQDRLADRIGGAAEATLAIAGADDHDRVCTRPIVVGHQRTACGRRHRQPVKELAGHVLALCELRLPVDHHVESPGRVVGKEAGEDGPRDLLQTFERGMRKDGGGDAAGIRIGAAVDRVQDELGAAWGAEVDRSAPPFHDGQRCRDRLPAASGAGSSP